MLKEHEDVYESYFEMFGSKGWELYKKTIIEEREALFKAGFYELKSELELGKLQGAIHYIDMILSLENNMENMYDEAKRQNKEEEDDKNYVGQIEDGG
jgi:hypothetical protein|tara:strand:- start:689 stop:982 length:294 start_codon:yes stop_codon:yes gene_type:complete